MSLLPMLSNLKIINLFIVLGRRAGIRVLFLLLASACCAAPGVNNQGWWGSVHPSLLDGLVSYWKLDEVSGTRFDSWGTNHLTDVNSVGSAAGLISNALTNDSRSSTKRLTISALSNANFETTNFTANVWVSRPSPSGSGFVFSKWESGIGKNNAWSIYHEGSGIYAFYYVTNVTTLSQFGRYSIATNSTTAFSMLTVACENGSSSVFHNGSRTSINSGFSLIPTNTANIYFYCTSGSSGDGTIGLIDESAFWSRALTTNEIQLLYNSGKARRFPFNSGP